MPLETTVPMVVTLPPGSLEMVYMVVTNMVWDVPEDELEEAVAVVAGSKLENEDDCKLIVETEVEMGEEKLWREEESGEAVRDEDAISDEEVSGLADMEELSSKDDEMVERDPVSIGAVVCMVDVLVR